MIHRCQPEPAVKLRPSVASVISEHVVFELESIDRLYLNVYVPRLQREGGVAAFGGSCGGWRLTRNGGLHDAARTLQACTDQTAHGPRHRSRTMP
jgi:hypothetical protein